MFFIHAMGRRNHSSSAKTLEELGKKMEKEIANNTYEMITVSIGKDDTAVMPYVWISRNLDTDEWEGEAGDSIKLGIKDGLIHERDALEFLHLNKIVQAVMPVHENKSKTKSTVKKTEKLSEEEMKNEANKLIKDFFTSLHEEK